MTYIGESGKVIKCRLGEAAKPERFLALQKKKAIADCFVKWRIGDVNWYYTTVGGGEYRANSGRTKS